MLNERIAELGTADLEQGPAAAGAPVAGAPGPAAVATGAAPPGAGAASASAAHATVNIRIAPALKSRLTGDAPLFVFAREPGGGGPPLAAKRLTSAALGTEVRLSAADSLIPGRVARRGSEGVDHRANFLQRATSARCRRFIRRTYL